MDYRIYQRSYDTFAGRYDEIFEPQQGPKIRALAAALGVPPPEPCLDLGAGTGLFARLTGWTCIEVDVSREMLLSPPRPGCVQARLDRLPFSEASFGTLISVTSLLDFDPDVAPLREWARVLRPGGRLVLSVLKRENLPALEQALQRERFAVERELDLGLDWGCLARYTPVTVIA